MKSGSVESLKLSLRWGAKAKARHTRWTLVLLKPQAAASERVLQCVAFLGVDSKVIVSTRSTSASLRRRGVPGRGSSNKPSTRLCRKRLRHFANRLLGHSQVFRDRRITLPFGTRQNDASPLGQRLNRLRPSCPLLQSFTFSVAQVQRWYRSSHSYQFLLYN